MAEEPAGPGRSYRSAGVDLAAADRLVSAIGPAVTATWGPEVVGSFGGFAAGLRIPDGYRRPILMLSTDGVGTKAELARLAGSYHGLGFDLVAMCVDDLAAAGARPLGLVDYLAVGRLDEGRDRILIESVARACEATGCALLGGEVAEHPGVMDPDRFDLAGAALGVVEEGAEVTGERIRPGDLLVAVASPNLRANGFSLVRRVLGERLEDPFPDTDLRIVEVLLEPSVIYASAIAAVLERIEVHGLAHVTGGGLPGNLVRILPEGCRAVIDRSTWDPPPVFRLIGEVGGIPEDEMLRTFNMGVGFVVVVAPDEETALISLLRSRGHDAWVQGEVVAGARRVEISAG